MTDDPNDSDDAAARDEAVADFLDDADTVLSEYDQGYMDADAALSRLTVGIDDLRAASGNEGGNADGNGSPDSDADSVGE